MCVVGGGVVCSCVVVWLSLVWSGVVQLCVCSGVCGCCCA